MFRGKTGEKEGKTVESWSDRETVGKGCCSCRRIGKCIGEDQTCVGEESTHVFRGESLWIDRQSGDGEGIKHEIEQNVLESIQIFTRTMEGLYFEDRAMSSMDVTTSTTSASRIEGNPWENNLPRDGLKEQSATCLRNYIGKASVLPA